jgi:hypothetical protein
MAGKTKTVRAQKTMPAASRKTTAPATAAADLDRTFADLARTVARYRLALKGFADGTHGPIPESIRRHLFGMIETNEADLSNLALCLAGE